MTTAGSIIAGGNVTLRGEAGSVVLGAINAGGTLSVTAIGGAISSTTAPAIVANRFNAYAAQDIVLTGPNIDINQFGLISTGGAFSITGNNGPLDLNDNIFARTVALGTTGAITQVRRRHHRRHGQHLVGREQSDPGPRQRRRHDQPERRERQLHQRRLLRRQRDHGDQRRQPDLEHRQDHPDRLDRKDRRRQPDRLGGDGAGVLRRPERHPGLGGSRQHQRRRHLPRHGRLRDRWRHQRDGPDRRAGLRRRGRGRERRRPDERRDHRQPPAGDLGRRPAVQQRQPGRPAWPPQRRRRHPLPRRRQLYPAGQHQRRRRVDAELRHGVDPAVRRLDRRRRLLRNRGAGHQPDPRERRRRP